jgi:hypothetical protein
VEAVEDMVVAAAVSLLVAGIVADTEVVDVATHRIRISTTKVLIWLTMVSKSVDWKAYDRFAWWVLKDFRPKMGYVY